METRIRPRASGRVFGKQYRQPTSFKAATPPYDIEFDKGSRLTAGGSAKGFVRGVSACATRRSHPDLHTPPPLPINHADWTTLAQRAGLDRESLLVISHPDAVKAGGAKGAKSRAAAAAGRNGNAYLPEMLFLCILRQQMSWPADLAVGGVEGGAAGGRGGSAQKEKPAKHRRA